MQRTIMSAKCQRAHNGQSGQHRARLVRPSPFTRLTMLSCMWKGQENTNERQVRKDEHVSVKATQTKRGRINAHLPKPRREAVLYHHEILLLVELLDADVVVGRQRKFNLLANQLEGKEREEKHMLRWLSKKKKLARLADHVEHHEVHVLTLPRPT